MRTLILLVGLSSVGIAATCPSITSGANTIEFCAPGTTSWVKPGGVYRVTVEGEGGGAGGTNQGGNVGTAGGGGGYSKIAGLSISGTVAMAIGAAGAGGTGSAGQGSAGGDS